jgi:type IV secretion system protein VirB6
MGIVELIYTFVTDALSSVAEAQFGEMVALVGGTAQTLSIIVVILTLINMSTQTVPASASASVMLLVKITLIALFLQNWTQFNVVAESVLDLFDRASGAMVASFAADSGAILTTPRSFAQSFDILMADVAAYFNVTAGRMNILGSVISGIMWLLSGVFSVAAAFIMVASRIVITLCIGLAPLAILCTLTSFTKHWFEKWLSFSITMAIYPVVIAGVFSTILGISKHILNEVGEANSIASLGAVIPVLGVLIMSIGMAAMVPIIVSGISGSVGVSDLVTRATAGGISQAARGAGSAAKNFGGGMMGSGPSENAGYVGRGANALGGAARNAASSSGEQVNSRAAGINRASERMARLRRK